MKGYKVFNPDWTCNNFHFKVGETYKHMGEIEMCVSGFHFCEKVNYCFSYYSFDPDNKIAEVEAVGKVIKGNNKHVTSEIKIIRELSWEEMLVMANTGICNSGHTNSGNWNSGNWNSGHRNSGNNNSGNWNSGHTNSGHTNSGHTNSGHTNSGNNNSGNWNSGNRNSGNWNSGNWNSGNWNSGNNNSGNWNSGNNNSGNMNSDDGIILIFNKKFIGNLNNIIWPDFFYFDVKQWVSSGNMSMDEKEKYKSHKTIGGYLKNYSIKEAWKKSWDNAPREDKIKVFDLPNFNRKVFYEITGIDLRGKSKKSIK